MKKISRLKKVAFGTAQDIAESWKSDMDSALNGSDPKMEELLYANIAFDLLNQYDYEYDKSVALFTEAFNINGYPMTEFEAKDLIDTAKGNSFRISKRKQASNPSVMQDFRSEITSIEDDLSMIRNKMNCDDMPCFEDLKDMLEDIDSDVDSAQMTLKKLLDDANYPGDGESSIFPSAW